MKNHELQSVSEQLRNQFHEFSNYIQSTLKKSEPKSQTVLMSPIVNSLSQTQRTSNSSRAINKNFRMKSNLTKISEPALPLMSRVRVFTMESSKDPNSKSYKQKAICKSLFEGSKTSHIQGLEYKTTERIYRNLEENAEEMENTEKELKEFMDSLFLLHELHYDISLTYGIAHSKDNNFNETSQIGFFFNVQNELKEIMNKELGENIEIAELEVIGLMDKYMTFMREIFRSMKKNNDSDNAVILEMI